MTTLTLTARSTHKRIRSISLPRLNWKIVYLFGIITTLLMLIFYIYLINKLTEGVYLTKNYNKEVSALLSENKVLEVNFAKTDFLGSVMDKAKVLSFEKTKDIKYVQILEGPLAKAK